MLGLLSRLFNTSSGRSSLDLSAFCEPERARGELERIAARAPGASLDALLPLLAEAPNPDQSLNLLERLIDKSDEQLLHVLSRNPTLLRYVILIFGHSYWLG